VTEHEQMKRSRISDTCPEADHESSIGEACGLVTRDGEGGATVPWVLRVDVGTNGSELEVLRAINARDLKVGWSANRQLTVSAACAEILNFTNVVDIYSPVRSKFERIEIKLDAGGLC
jgi:hypothetical protein